MTALRSLPVAPESGLVTVPGGVIGRVSGATCAAAGMAERARTPKKAYRYMMPHKVKISGLGFAPVFLEH
jgi:hypothetical protein